MAQQLFPEFQVIIVPGLHDSGPGHWQTRWHRAHPAFFRVRQDDWANPDLARWSARVDQVRASDPRPALLVAHSFGCLAAVHSIAARRARRRRRLPGGARRSGQIRRGRPAAGDVAARPSLLIGSRDDPWMRADHAAAWARRWGSGLIDAGALGHINAESRPGRLAHRV